MLNNFCFSTELFISWSLGPLLIHPFSPHPIRPNGTRPNDEHPRERTHLDWPQAPSIVWHGEDASVQLEGGKYGTFLQRRINFSVKMAVMEIVLLCFKVEWVHVMGDSGYTFVATKETDA